MTFEELLAKDYLNAIKQNKKYFVYKYTFNDGKVYIGRSNTKSDRYGNIEDYKKQSVYNKMLEDPNFKKERIYYSYSILDVAEREHYLIKQNYNNSYNVDSEYKYKEHVEEQLRDKYEPKKPVLAYEENMPNTLTEVNERNKQLEQQRQQWYQTITNNKTEDKTQGQDKTVSAMNQMTNNMTDKSKKQINNTYISYTTNKKTIKPKQIKKGPYILAAIIGCLAVLFIPLLIELSHTTQTTKTQTTKTQTILINGYNIECEISYVNDKLRLKNISGLQGDFSLDNYYPLIEIKSTSGKIISGRLLVLSNNYICIDNVVSKEIQELKISSINISSARK